MGWGEREEEDEVNEGVKAEESEEVVKVEEVEKWDEEQSRR